MLQGVVGECILQIPMLELKVKEREEGDEAMERLTWREKAIGYRKGERTELSNEKGGVRQEGMESG